MILDPTIKQYASLIYRINPVKYKRLIQWIKTYQKKQYTDAMIAETLKRYALRRITYRRIINWWPYLTGLLDKVRTEMLQAESEQYKTISKKELVRMRDVLKRIIEDAAKL